MSDTLSLIREGYDRWASVYDHDANPLPGLEESFVQRAVGDPCGLHVLDLGCGTGRHSIWLAAAGAEVTGVDFSEGMLEKAQEKRHADRVNFIQHDLHQPLPFANGEFDLVLSGLVLEHLHNLAQFFSEAKRVTRAGGRAVISAMHPAMFLRGSQARFTDPTTGGLVQPGGIPHSIGAFVMAAVRAGFELTNVEEAAPDDQLAARFSRAEKYIGWPMLVVLQLKA